MMSGPEVKHLWICSLSLGRRCQPAHFENRPLERALFRATSVWQSRAQTKHAFFAFSLFSMVIIKPTLSLFFALESVLEDRKSLDCLADRLTRSRVSNFANG